MPPKTPRFITPSTASQQLQPVNPQQPPPRQPRFTPASSAPATAPRSTPKFVSAPPSSSSSSSQKRPLFRPPPPALPSTPTPASRLAFTPAAAANEQIDSDIVTDSSPILPRKRRWEYEDDDDDTHSSPPPSSPDLPSPTLSRTLRTLPFTPLPPATTPTGIVVAPPLFRPTAVTESHLLPLDWSPTKKRGGKYVEGGIAAMVAGWVVETRNAQGRRKGGEVVATGVRVEEGFIAVVGGEGEGLVLVRGREKGGGEGGRRVVFEWPWWEVEVEGGTWRMCVFWAVVEGVGEGDDEEMLF
ncbi:hypothetical protein K440DRAFT_625483 [Wilcoxina mikolae CBS 423.85]|nr:hypothetical protein K440DRAFT_625483 [Wilcoxina mikolae CBS 423.85]